MIELKQVTLTQKCFFQGLIFCELNYIFVYQLVAILRVLRHIGLVRLEHRLP